MKSFFDIEVEPARKVTLQEFIDSMQEASLRESIINMFIPYDEIIKLINVMYGVQPVEHKPEIIIHLESDLMPETVFGGRIEMGSKFLLGYFDIKVSDISGLVKSFNKYFPIIDFIPIVSMMWTYSHEYFHFVRRHDDVVLKLKEIEGDAYPLEITSYAIERDADLCAIGVIYRYLQIAFKDINIPDLEIRKLSLFMIFWSMRKYSKPVHGDSHLAMSMRIYDLVSKLAIITLSNAPGEKVDIAMSDESTTSRYKALFEFFVHCEKKFTDMQNSGGQSEFVELYRRDEVEGIMSQVRYRWDAMRQLVSEISKTAA